jgi:hypothetical protein
VLGVAIAIVIIGGLFDLILKVIDPRPGFRVRARFDSGRVDCGDRIGMARAYAPGACYFIFASYTARRLVGIPVGIGSNLRRKLLYIQMVMAVVEYRPGAPR